MTLKTRLNRVEAKIGEKNKSFAPIIIILYEDDNEEAVIKHLKAKYGQDYSSRIIIRCPKTREEARRENILFYREIEDL